MRRILTLLLMLAFPASVFFYPPLFKVLVGGFLFVGVGIAGLVLLLVIGALLWRKFSPASFKKSGITIADQTSIAFVGSPGVGSRLRFGDKTSFINVEWSGTDYAVIILVTGFFGPGIVLFYLFQPEKFTPNIPLPIVAAVVGLVGLAFYSFVRQLYTYFWARPSLRISPSQIEFLHGPKVVKTVDRHQIKALVTRIHTYCDSDGDNHPNYVLVAALSTGEEERLCISCDKQQSDALLAAVGRRMRVATETAPEPTQKEMDQDVSAEVKALKQSGKMIQAIKLVRAQRKIGLKEAKDYVESL